MGEWKRENLDISQPVSRRPTHVPAFKCQIRRRPWAACTWLLAINQAVDAIYGPANSMSYCLPACCATPPTPHVTLQPFANRLDPLPPSSLATFPLATYRRSLPFSPECMSLPFVFAFAQKLNCTGEQFN